MPQETSEIIPFRAVPNYPKIMGALLTGGPGYVVLAAVPHGFKRADAALRNRAAGFGWDIHIEMITPVLMKIWRD